MHPVTNLLKRAFMFFKHVFVWICVVLTCRIRSSSAECFMCCSVSAKHIHEIRVTGRILQRTIFKWEKNPSLTGAFLEEGTIPSLEDLKCNMGLRNAGGSVYNVQGSWTGLTLSLWRISGYKSTHLSGYCSNIMLQQVVIITVNILISE